MPLNGVAERTPEAFVLITDFDDVANPWEGPPMQRSISEFSSLLGVWVGNGSGVFPTIKSFEFRDEIRFSRRGSEELIHYEQITFLKDDTPSHWESGFLKFNSNGFLEISNAQDSGRVEILEENSFRKTDRGFRIELKSKALQNDPRLRETIRIFELVDNTLSYSIAMATQVVTESTPHIRAELRRS